jgi:hypothetical protein
MGSFHFAAITSAIIMFLILVAMSFLTPPRVNVPLPSSNQQQQISSPSSILINPTIINNNNNNNNKFKESDINDNNNNNKNIISSSPTIPDSTGTTTTIIISTNGENSDQIQETVASQTTTTTTTNDIIIPQSDSSATDNIDLSTTSTANASNFSNNNTSSATKLSPAMIKLLQDTYSLHGSIVTGMRDPSEFNAKYGSLPRSRVTWRQRLYTPTYVALQLGYWWIVDCWHHRVLYRKRREGESDADIDALRDFEKDWKILKVANATWITIPHSLATDGKSLIVIESSIGGSADGTHHSILVFEKIPLEHPLRKYGKLLRANGNKTVSKSGATSNNNENYQFDVAAQLYVYNDDDDFLLVQRLVSCPYDPEAIYKTARPHKLVFDAAIKAFLLYMTSPGALSRFDVITKPMITDDEASLKLDQPKIADRLSMNWCHQLPWMRGSYARSIALNSDNTSLLFTIGPGSITRLNHRLVTASMNESQILPTLPNYNDRNWKISRSSMNDIMWYNGYYYITSTNRCRFFRVKQLPVKSEKRSPAAKAKAASTSKFLPADFKSTSLLGYFNLCNAKQRTREDYNGALYTANKRDLCTSTGTPYFMSVVGQRIYFTYIFSCSGVYSFIPYSGKNESAPIAMDIRHHFGSEVFETTEDGKKQHIGFKETLEDVVLRGKNW